MLLRNQGYCRVGRGLSGHHWVWCNGRGPHFEMRLEPQASSPFLTPITESLQSWDRRVRLILLEEWNSARLSSCLRGDRPLVELCVEPVGFSGRCTGVSVPLGVVPSSTGFPSKWCAGIGFLSRADREIGVFWNAAPHTRLRLEFPRETGLMLRCPWKVGKAFQTKQGN